MRRLVVATILTASALGRGWPACPPALADGHPPQAAPAVGAPRLMVQLGHADSVTAVAYSADGKLILTGSWDATAALWDVASGEELRRLVGHSTKISSVAFSPDGTRVLTGSWDCTARLWDTASGKELRRFEGPSREVNAVAFSPDGKRVLTGSSDGLAYLWEIESGQEVLRFVGHAGAIKSVAFSADGRQVLTGSDDQTARLWDAATGKIIRGFTGNSGAINAVAFAPRQKWLLAGAADGTLRLWDAASGREIRRFEGHKDGVLSVAFSPDGQQILSGGFDKTARLWEVAAGKEIRHFEGHADAVASVAFSPDGSKIVTGSFDKTARLWNTSSGRPIFRLAGQAEPVWSVAFAPDGKQILTAGNDALADNKSAARLWDFVAGKEMYRFGQRSNRVTSAALSPSGKQVLSGSFDHIASLWDAATGKEVRRFAGHSDRVNSVAFSPDGKQILTGSADNTARLWEAASGKEIHRLVGHTQAVFSVAVSPDGKQLLTGSWDGSARIWDAAGGKEIRRFHQGADHITSVAFSPDGKQILTGSAYNMARLWNVASGKEIRRFDHRHVNSVRSVAFSPDGKQALTGSLDGTARLWDTATGMEIRSFEGHSAEVTSVAFSPDGRKVLTGSLDCTSRLWDAATGKELCVLVSFADGDWAIVDSTGRFDASNGGSVAGLHWVVGNEPIELAQLKERYYEPGLLAKKMGFNPEPLRNVEGLTNPKLFPAIVLSPPKANDPALEIALTNRGGGIGRVVVRINGKELLADARGTAHDPNAPSLALKIPLPPNQPLLIAGRPNKIEVEAYNAEGYLRSRGLEFDYEPPSPASTEPPRIWILVAGVSNYRGESLRLHYAAKDASDFAKAVEIGAKRLFGPDRVHLALLSGSPADPRHRPTRANLLAAFQAIRDGNAKSSDVLVVYLAGHGVNYGGQDGDFYFLTCDAQSADLSDPAVRQSVALSGKEIAEQINSVPALKQVLLLDTCASGRLIEKLTEKRDVPTSQVRALDRLKDRTGMFVLAGCAADSVSYEASRYGQGVLTYSLLLGLRGSALREDQFVDVDKLFGFAADEVPQLAHDLGGIQRPVIAVPKGSASFDIGQLLLSDREQIPLQPARPLVLRSTFGDEDAFDDVLRLSKRVDEMLRSSSIRGSKRGVVFVDAREIPDGYRLIGRYKTSDGKTTVTAKLFCDQQKPIEFSITGESKQPDELAQKIVAEVEKLVSGDAAR